MTAHAGVFGASLFGKSAVVRLPVNTVYCTIQAGSWDRLSVVVARYLCDGYELNGEAYRRADSFFQPLKRSDVK